MESLDPTGATSFAIYSGIGCSPWPLWYEKAKSYSPESSADSFGKNVSSDDAGFSRQGKLTQTSIAVPAPFRGTHQEKIEVELQGMRDPACVTVSGFCWQSQRKWVGMVTLSLLPILESGAAETDPSYEPVWPLFIIFTLLHNEIKSQAKDICSHIIPARITTVHSDFMRSLDKCI